MHNQPIPSFCIVNVVILSLQSTLELPGTFLKNTDSLALPMDIQFQLN